MPSSFKLLSYFAIYTLLVTGCRPKSPEQVIKNPTLIEYKVQSTLTHDTKAFTQGLEIHNGQLYESTGGKGSWIGIVDVNTGIADKRVALDDKYFGEGITIFGDKIYQLTWQNHEGFVYDLASFRKIRSFRYRTEGWGLTHDSTYLIMSDGSNKLYYLDTATLATVRTLEVKDGNGPVGNLNELEYAEGRIYANIWQTNYIARVNPLTGNVDGYLDLGPLTRQAKLANAQADVLNGIAWHDRTRAMLVTGKLWPYLFIIRMREPSRE
ncbi:MAG: glutaminyl-peptide cyclotransferase [Bacteroidetes bacterium]|nr:glutaminyl-peptide cyclotransferase [Bacteroidota bacterium]